MPNPSELLQHFSESASQWSVPLAFAWAGWMAVGLALSIWFKRTYQHVEVAPAYADTNWDATPSPSVKPKASKPAPAIRPQQPQPDAFAELSAMLDSPAVTEENKEYGQ